jgi:hypothetical protein
MAAPSPAKAPAAEFPQKTYVSDIGPRVGKLEQSAVLLETEMRDVRDSLRTMVQAQERTSNVLLRMEAAEQERQRTPKAPWWTYIMSASAAIALMFGIASGFSWFFNAQFDRSITPIVMAVGERNRDLAERETLLDRRVALIESAFSWKPVLKEVIPGPGMGH